MMDDRQKIMIGIKLMGWEVGAQAKMSFGYSLSSSSLTHLSSHRHVDTREFSDENSNTLTCGVDNHPITSVTTYYYSYS